MITLGPDFVPGRWRRWSAEVCAAFPLAASDWEAHSDAVDAGLYSVRNRSFSAAPASSSDPFSCKFADEPPLSLEEEEALSASAVPEPAQAALF